MRLEHEFKELIKDAVREVIEEEVKRGRLSQQPFEKPPVSSQPSNETSAMNSRDPNAIMRPAELAGLLSVSIPTLYRWNNSGELPAKIQLCGRSVGWRYADIVEWLKR